VILVDTALARRAAEGRPIQVALIGAGYMARGYAHQMLTTTPGIRVAVIANRTPARAQAIYAEAGSGEVRVVTTPGELEDAVRRGQPAVTEDAIVASTADGIDVVVEATGEVEFGAEVTLAALQHRKHVVLSNAELDATVGPILKVYADRAGVVLTNTDGDEPGVAMNLVRFARSIGYRPVLAGNLKGFIDPHRTPDTQREFARTHQLSPAMATSFADGTKLSMETTILANATGLRAATRGMRGHRCGHVRDVLNLFSADELLRTGGFVEYLLGAEPGTGAFVVGYNDDPIKAQYMSYFKMGSGPLYVFYTPYHLPQLQLPHTVARAALFADPTVTPLGAPVCEVVAIAKRDLAPGEMLDGIGGFTCYGAIENADVAADGDLLPMGLSGGCRLRRAVAADQEITRADVEVPAGRLSDRLAAEQVSHFGMASRASAAVAGRS
jgi:predicted homoserine dehydrogenase-like protein